MIGRFFEAGGRVSALLPPGLRYGLARAGGSVGFRLLPGVRRQALENYAGVLHLPLKSAEVRRVAREALAGYAKLLADFLALSKLSRDDVMRMVDWRGWDNIQAALAQGKGVIVVTPHFGNWDMAAAAAAARGLSVTAVTDHYGDDDLNRRIIAARERFGVSVVAAHRDRRSGRPGCAAAQSDCGPGVRPRQGRPQCPGDGLRAAGAGPCRARVLAGILRP